MVKILRQINERFEDFELISFDGLYLLLALIGIPMIVALVINLDLRVIGVCFIFLGLILWVENYRYEKKFAKK